MRRPGKSKGKAAIRASAKPKTTISPGNTSTEVPFDKNEHQIRELTQSLERKTRELQEARDFMVATHEVLKVISSSASHLQPILETIASAAGRLCEANYVHIYKLEPDGNYYLAATSGIDREYSKELFGKPFAPGRGSLMARAALECKTVHIPNFFEDTEYTLPIRKQRSGLGIPLMREGVPIGVIVVLRTKIRPFSRKHIELVSSFADQAVIALNNTKLLNALQMRTEELSESLKQQTATAEVLKIISRSTFDLESILEILVESAARVCDAENGVIYRREGDLYQFAARYGFSEIFEEYASAHPYKPGRSGVTARAALDAKTIHIEDVLADPEYTATGYQELGDFRTALGVPLLREGEPIGVFALARTQVRPFTPKQIELVETFADQAVIAIENVRLLEELREKNREVSESLEQQTATAEILRVISTSPTDAQPVFEVIAANTARLCNAQFCNVFRYDGKLVHFVAHNRLEPEGVAAVAAMFPAPPNRGTVAGRAILSGTVEEIEDHCEDAEYAAAPTLVSVYRSLIGIPIMRKDVPVGAMVVARPQVGKFPARQIELLKTFADQAGIAIENARLFGELQERTVDLAESLQQQTATADVLKVISRSTFDLETVLNTLLKSATRLCGGHIAWVFQRDGDILRWMAGYGHTPKIHERLNAFFKEKVVPIDHGSIIGRTTCNKAVVQVSDILADHNYQWGEAQKIGAYRACLGVPLLREGNVVGVLFIARTAPQPFSEKQVELAKTFADQALIAIENTRLVAELQESLDQQTATADVLSAISRTTFDLNSVMTTLLGAAARFCRADQGVIARDQDGIFRRVATFGFPKQLDREIRAAPLEADRTTAAGRALIERRIIHIADVRSDPDYNFASGLEMGGFRTVLAVPMLRGETVIGVFALVRTQPDPFTERQIELVSNFADHAAIAIANVRLFESVEERSRELAISLKELRMAQDRLVQTEKLASLGQLTAGIAHEIKNPLNFVSNFSSVSIELIDELAQAQSNLATSVEAQEEIRELTELLRGNLEKIVQHGKRADSIVKNMLLHARQSSGEHRLTDINALAEESLNLAYHGARAEMPGFDIKLESDLDPAAGEADIFPQEITRVLLNLISNGFYAAMKRKAAEAGPGYEPVLQLCTRNLGEAVEIAVRDNGTGIPPEVKDKLFSPFFTTKPAGEGTGLGLSISHDIVVKQHNGQIDIDSVAGEYTECRIVLPRYAATEVT